MFEKTVQHICIILMSMYKILLCFITVCEVLKLVFLRLRLKFLKCLHLNAIFFLKPLINLVTQETCRFTV